MIFQVIGAIIGSAVLFALVSTGAHDGPTATGSNGFGEGEMLQAFIAEAVFTFIFVLVVLGSTDPKKEMCIRDSSLTDCFGRGTHRMQYTGRKTKTAFSNSSAIHYPQTFPSWRSMRRKRMDIRGGETADWLVDYFRSGVEYRAERYRPVVCLSLIHI